MKIITIYSCFLLKGSREISNLFFTAEAIACLLSPGWFVWFFSRRMQYFSLQRGNIITCTMPEMDGKHLAYENFPLLSLFFAHKCGFPFLRGNSHTSLSSKQVIPLMAKKKCLLMQWQKRLSHNLCEVIQSLPPRSIRKLLISKDLLTFQQQ